MTALILILCAANCGLACHAIGLLNEIRKHLKQQPPTETNIVKAILDRNTSKTYSLFPSHNSKSQ